jgi:hypothetical protein
MEKKDDNNPEMEKIYNDSRLVFNLLSFGCFNLNLYNYIYDLGNF